MVDMRKKNCEWIIHTNLDGKTTPNEDAQLAVLMDIRDELQKLNALLHCVNFIGIPFRLERIEKNTRKQRPKAKRD